MRRPPDARRATAPGVGNRRRGSDHRQAISLNPTPEVSACPVACSPPCPWRCPVTIGQSLAVLVDDLAVAS